MALPAISNAGVPYKACVIVAVKWLQRSKCFVAQTIQIVT